MKNLILWCVLLCSSQACLALAPYLKADKLPGADLTTQLAQLERTLQAEGLTTIGRRIPKGLPGHASLVVTDPAILAALRTIGGSAVIASGIRVGVQSDGTVSYMNPDYWYRAYLQGQFKSAQPAVKSVQMRQAKALGEGSGFGGVVPEADLADYRYMLGMERFDSVNSELNAYGSFDEALKAVQGNLSKGTAATSRVYEVAMSQNQMAGSGNGSVHGPHEHPRSHSQHALPRRGGHPLNIFLIGSL